MTTCSVCWNKLRISRDHGEEPCVVRASLWCSQCSCYGHEAPTCDVATHVRRPATLEELIPVDVRERWGLATETPIVWPGPQTLEDAEREIAEANTIEVRYREGKRDSRIREVMGGLKIKTVHKMDDNLQRLRSWAIASGKKVRLVLER